MRNHHAAVARRRRRRGFFRLNPLYFALLLVLVASLPVTWAGGGPADADGGTEAPAKPSELEVTTQLGSRNVSVIWDDVDGASEYLVRWRPPRQ